MRWGRGILLVWWLFRGRGDDDHGVMALCGKMISSWDKIVYKWKSYVFALVRLVFFAMLPKNGALPYDL